MQSPFQKFLIDAGAGPMVIQVFARQVYGRPLIYPANPAAQVAAQLAGVKTFSPAQLELLRDLGLEVQRLEDPAAVAVLS